MSELKPCPFCGSRNIDPKGWVRNDGVSGPACDDCVASAESVEAWNRRAPAPAEVCLGCGGKHGEGLPCPILLPQCTGTGKAGG